MRTRHILLAAALIAGSTGIVRAQQAGTYDPSQLPAIQGTVGQYSLTPRGDVDGLILTDGTEVHMPPHLGTQLVFAVRPGDMVTVHGLRARAIPMVQALSISNDATGNIVTDSEAGGPAGPRGALQILAAEGHIKTQLHGPQGDLNGVLLEDGTIVRLPPPEANRRSAELAPGGPLFVQGEGYSGPLGRVIEATSIGSSQDQLAPIATRPQLFGPRVGRRPPPPPSPGLAPPPPPSAQDPG
jgi:hypothetical protein